MDQKTRLLDIQDLAKLLNVHPSWIYAQIHGRTLPFPYLKVGHYLRFRREDIETYIEKEIDRPKGN